MPLKKWFVEGDVLDRDYTSLVELEDTIHQQERVAMRQQAENSLNFGRLVFSHGYSETPAMAPLLRYG
jgi:hypothetical protein